MFPLVCGQKARKGIALLISEEHGTASVPHKTSITDELETDIPGFPQNPLDLLDTQVENSL